MIQRHDGQDRLDQRQDAMAIGPHKTAGMVLSRVVAIDQDDLVTMAH